MLSCVAASFDWRPLALTQWLLLVGPERCQRQGFLKGDCVDHQRTGLILASSLPHQSVTWVSLEITALSIGVLLLVSHWPLQVLLPRVSLCAGVEALLLVKCGSQRCAMPCAASATVFGRGGPLCSGSVKGCQHCAVRCQLLVLPYTLPNPHYNKSYTVGLSSISCVIPF